MAGSVRQEARRKALEAQAKMKEERKKKERRLSGLGVDLMTVVEERDATVVRCDAKAGATLRKMTDDEGLSLREALAWCGPDLSRAEAIRLRKIGADDDGEDSGDEDGGGRGEMQESGAVEAAIEPEEGSTSGPVRG